MPIVNRLVFHLTVFLTQMDKGNSYYETYNESILPSPGISEYRFKNHS